MQRCSSTVATTSAVHAGLPAVGRRSGGHVMAAARGLGAVAWRGGESGEIEWDRGRRQRWDQEIDETQRVFLLININEKQKQKDLEKIKQTAKPDNKPKKGLSTMMN
uniref:Uncharacterized protein n=1 Tax=Arundo donax TaxID=35708 RepID=A0A0A9CU47_ARUDO